MATTTLLTRHCALRPTTLRALKPTFNMSVRTQSTFRNPLVTPAELDAALRSNAPSKLSTAPRTIPVCGSWFLPNDPQKRSGYEVFKQSHIPGARFFDIDAVSDRESPYAHMLPSADVFADAMRDMGVNSEDTVVVYDTAELGIFSAPRVAWTMRVFGHSAVHVLNNFRLWKEQGYATEAGEQAAVTRSEYPAAKLDASRVAAFEEVRALAKDHNKEGREEVNVLDARSYGRWAGTDPEPRPGMSSGHIPGSLSVPVPELLDPVTKAFLPAEELRAVFERKGVDPSKAVISSCGSGVTAAVVDAALVEAGLGEGSRKVYDGSWGEWAQRVGTTENLIVKSE